MPYRRVCQSMWEQLLNSPLFSQLTGRVTGGLGHPSLIYQLCLRAGVKPSTAEEMHHPSPMINHKMLRSFEQQARAGGVAQATTAAATAATDAPEGEPAAVDEAGPSSRPPTTRRPGRAAMQTSPPSVEKLEKEIAKMKHILRLVVEELLDTRKELKREQRKGRARQDQAFQENRQQFAYMSESMQTLAALLQGTSAQASTSSLMPSPPHFSVYPPPTPPDSSEEEEDEEEEDEEDNPEE